MCIFRVSSSPRSDVHMKNGKLPPRRSANMSTPKPEIQAAAGQTRAEKNREQEARVEILQAFNRLAVPHSQWPKFVQEFYTTAGQRTEYHHFVAPPPFQAPRFDRLKQSPREWAIVADTAWERHRDSFLRHGEGWVTLGVDQRIDEKRVRGPGKRVSAAATDRARGVNTTIGQRSEWTAKYLVGVPLKEIAGAHEDASTVGRVAR